MRFKIILATLISIIFLVSLAALTQASVTIKNCILPGLSCKDHIITEDSISLKLRYDYGYSMNITSIKIEGCSGTDSGFLEYKESNIFTINGCKYESGQKLKAGYRFRGDVNISYIHPDTALNHTINGWISDRIEKSGTKISKFRNLMQSLETEFEFLILILLFNLPLISFLSYKFSKRILKTALLVIILTVILLSYFINVSTFWRDLPALFLAILVINLPLIALFFIYGKYLENADFVAKAIVIIPILIFLLALMLLFLTLFFNHTLRFDGEFLDTFLLFYYPVTLPALVAFILYELLKDKPTAVKVIVIILAVIFLLLHLISFLSAHFEFGVRSIIF